MVHPRGSSLAATGHADESVPPTSAARNDAGLALGVPAQFLADLAAHTDGIGWIQTLESLRRHGVLGELARHGAQGICLGALARSSGANAGYLALVLRVLSAQGFVWREIERDAAQSRVGLRAAGRELVHLLGVSGASADVTRFTPVATQMSAYLRHADGPARGGPELGELVRSSRRGWDLPAGSSERQRGVARRLAAALDGNLVGPVVVALHETFGLGREGQRPEFAPRGDRLRAAFDLLAHVGWVDWVGNAAHLTERGAYAARRALAFGVPVSYLPLFERIDELLFGDAEEFWRRVEGEPERHIDRALNVRSSGASHRRYFGTVDEVLLNAFNRPFEEQPRGFCDMGSGDGAWLEHVWELVLERTERGRLIRQFPNDDRYRLLIVGRLQRSRAAGHARKAHAGGHPAYRARGRHQ